MPAALEYVTARNSGEVLTALADGDTWVLAGGQSLVLDVTSGDARPRRVVDINRVAEFDALAEVDGMVRVAPLVRHRTFESDAVGGALGVVPSIDAKAYRRPGDERRNLRDAVTILTRRALTQAREGM